MADTEAAAAAPPPPYTPREVVYCGVCTLPAEYCEFGGTVSKCAAWLKSRHPALHARLYSAAALASATSGLSVEAQKRAEKDSARKAAKAATAEAREAERKAASRVTIKRVERNKRKYVTEIAGLESFVGEAGVKKVAKELGKRFATGASVVKAAGGGAGGEVVVVQGDLVDDVEEWVLDNLEEVPEGNLEVVEEKKKKPGA